MKNKEGARLPDFLLTLFRRLDKDKSGRLGAKELNGLAKRFKTTGAGLLGQIDRDRNDSITYAEFAQFMRYHRTGKI